MLLLYEQEMNEQEFMKAYDSYADALFRHCYFRLYDRERAKDLVQDAFMKAWEYIAKGREVENIRAFLYRILHNLIVDEFRKKKTVSLDELYEKGIDIPTREKLDQNDMAEIKNIISIFRKLKPNYGDAVAMRYIDDLTPKEIATITGESENNVSVRINRATAQLRALMKIL